MEDNEKVVFEFDKETVDKAKVMGGVGTAGAVGGGLLGTKIGIAALGTAISGLWPLAIIGGIAGAVVGKKLYDKSKTEK